MVLASWILQLAAICAVVVTVCWVGGSRAGWFAAVALALAWLRAGPIAMSDLYNPALTIPAVIVATVAAAALVCGYWRALPVLIVSASFGAQLHFSAAPGLLAIAVIGVVAAVRTGRPGRRLLIASCVIAGVLWAPTAIDQVHGTGNISSLVHAVAKGAGTADQPHGLPPASLPRVKRGEAAVELVTLTVPNAATFGTLPGIAGPYLGAPGLSDPTPLRTALGSLLLVAVVAVAWMNRRKAPFGSAIIALSLLGASITYLATARTERGILWYYLAAVAGYAIALVVGLALVLERRLAGWTPPRFAPSMAAGVIALITIFVVFVGEARLATVADVTFPHPLLAFSNKVVEAVPDGCRANGIFLNAPVDQVADVWAVLVALDRRGIHATVARDLEPFVGPGHRRTGREALEVNLPTPAQMPAVTPGTLVPRPCS